MALKFTATVPFIVMKRYKSKLVHSFQQEVHILNMSLHNIILSVKSIVTIYSTSLLIYSKTYKDMLLDNRIHFTIKAVSGILLLLEKFICKIHFSFCDHIACFITSYLVFRIIHQYYVISNILFNVSGGSTED